jgi:hypothetical protein
MGSEDSKWTKTLTGPFRVLLTTIGKVDCLATRLISDPTTIEMGPTGVSVRSAGNAGIAANPMEAAIATIRTIVIFFNFGP